LLVESVTDYAIFMLDVEGRVMTWNLGAAKIKGYDANEIVGRHFSTFYLPADLAANKPDRELAEARELGRIEDEGWRLRKDGTVFWANIVITALRDHDGVLRGFAKVTRDQTQRRAAEERLRQVEERFRLLVEGITDYAIYMLDPGGRVTTWNNGAERMKGYTAQEAIGLELARFFPAEDVKSGRPERELAIAREQGRFEEEGWRVRKDGSRFWANVIVTPLWGASEQLLGYAKITRDLSGRRHAEETARALLREQAARSAAEDVAAKAEAANRVKDEFLATVSHELRTPLNAIVGWAAMLRQRELEPSVAKGMEVIHRNAQAQVKLVEDILDVSRIATGKLRLEPSPTDLTVLAKEALEITKYSAVAKQLSMDFEAGDGPCLVLGDPDRLRQAVWNLLSNAVKFTDIGGAVRVTVERHRSNVVLTVKDTGRGIEPEFLPFVFERFKQADASTTRRFGGLGLGLALVRHIVELHGGGVAVESDGPGQGSTFSVTLPIRAVTSRPPAGPPSVGDVNGSAKAGVLSGIRILVVDDDPDAQELLAAVLGGAGGIVETSGSAASGFDALRRFQPHVLVSDIGMPGEDGYSFVRRVRALDTTQGGGIPSIALTAYTRDEDRAKALAAGFTSHLGKPVEPAALVAAIADIAPSAAR
jgi:PAS domain S-box-containing protein